MWPLASDCSPAMPRSSVDLPEPFDPTIPTACPTGMSTERLLTACTMVDCRVRNPRVTEFAGAEETLLVHPVLDVDVTNRHREFVAPLRRPGRAWNRAQSRAYRSSALRNHKKPPIRMATDQMDGREEERSLQVAGHQTPAAKRDEAIHGIQREQRP